VKKQGGSDTVAWNRSRPLDLARADPFAAIKSQDRYRRVHGDGDLYMHMACDIAIADIASVIAYRGRNGRRPLNNCDERYEMGACDMIWTVGWAG